MENGSTERSINAAPETGCVHLRETEEYVECANRSRIRFYKVMIWVSALCGLGFGLMLIFTW